MPPVILAVGAALTGIEGAVAGGLMTLGLSAGAAFAVTDAVLEIGFTMLVTGGINMIAGALSGGQNSFQSQGLIVSSRNANAPWRYVYGHTRIAGVVTFIATRGTNNDYIDLVLTLCKGKVNAIQTMYFDGTAIPLDGSGNGTGVWTGLVHLEKDVGDPANAAQPFPGLATNQPGYWDSSCLQRGHAKVYVWLKYNQKQFGNGIPNITFDVQGRQVFDPRNSTTAYSENPALCIRDYLIDQSMGLMADSATEINDTDFIAAANICDETVALKGTVSAVTSIVAQGTGYAAGNIVGIPGGNGDASLWIAQTDAGGKVQKVNILNPGSGYVNASNLLCTGGAGSGLTIDISTYSGTEPRFNCNGAFESNQSPGAVLQHMTSAMAGWMSYIQGQFSAFAGAYSTPRAAIITDDDFRAPMDVQTRLSRRDIYNGVHGSYLSQANDWQPSDYPAILNGTYVTEDGATLWKQIDLPFTISAAMAQRIAKINLERSRRQTLVTAHCKLTVGDVRPADVVQITHARFGWTNKTFFVTDVAMVSDPDVGDDPALGIDLLLVETDANIYNWTASTDELAAPVPADAAPAPILYNLVAAVDPNDLALIDFSQAGHTAKIIDSIPDGTTRKAVTAIDGAGKALIDFSQAGHTNKNLDNVGDGATYLRRQGDASNDNIVQNGDFTNGTAFWSSMNIVSEADPWAVTRNCGRSNSLASFANLQNTQVFRVAPGDVYVYDFWYKTGGTGSWTLYRANFGDANGPTLGAPTVWTHYVAQYTVPSGADYSYTLQLLIVNTSATADTIDLAAVTIRKVRNTPDVQDNAITNSGAYSNYLAQAFNNGIETVVGLVTISTNGGIAAVFAMASNYSGAAPDTFRIRKDNVTGAILATAVTSVIGASATLVATDSSPAASQTYVLTALQSTGVNQTISGVSLVAMNLKK